MQARLGLRLSDPLLVLGGLTVFSPLIDGGTTHYPVLIIRLVILFALMAWVLLAMKSGRMVFYKNPLALAVAAFVVCAVLSVFRSPYTAVSLHWLISIVSYAGLLFLVVHGLDSAQQIRGLMQIVLGMGAFEAVAGIYQFLWLGNARAIGTFFNPNFFATYEMAVFTLAFGLLCFRRQGGSPTWETPILGVIMCLTFVALVLAQSRGALLAWVVAVGFIGIYRFGPVFLAALILCLLLVLSIPNPLQQRLLTVQAKDSYALTRLEIWKSSLDRIIDHPGGVGMGVYKFTSFQYRFPIENAITRFGKRAESAHNEYLEMGVELGVGGVAVFLIGMGVLGMEVREILTGPLEIGERGLVVGATGGIGGMLTHAGVDSVFHEPALVLLFVEFVGVILVLRRLRLPGRALVRVVPFPFHPARAALVGVLAAMAVVLVIRPASAWYAFDKGNGEGTAGQWDRALAWYQWAARIDPGKSGYHDAVANAEVALYGRSGDLNRLLQAVEELQVGLQLNPLDARLAYRLGGLSVLLAERAATGAQRETLMEQAALYYEQAIRLDPYSPHSYLELGKIRSAQERPEEAQAWFRRAASYEPNFLPARVQLAELSLRMGRKEIAAVEYDEIQKVKKRFQGWVLNSLERQYVEVEDGHLRRSLRGEQGS